jgi:hypothetical protein
MAGTAALGLSRELRTQPVRNRPRTSRRGQVEHKVHATLALAAATAVAGLGPDSRAWADVAGTKLSSG